MKKIERTDKEWRELLTPEQYAVCRLGGTESPFTGEYESNKATGKYVCAGCGLELFQSTGKYDSGTGWPSFFEPAHPNRIEESNDTSHGMARTEIRCARCESHLGHVFADGPEPSGLRFCTNSAALVFETTDDA
jgi:peptide-methionine (R)-S-oxide reductase